MAAPAATGNATPIDAILDRAPIGWFQIRVALLCALVAMLDGFDTQSVAFVAPVLGQEWDITPDRFGLIFAAGLVGIMVGQVVLGPLSDRWGRRPVIIACTVAFGIGSFATVLADNWIVLLLLRFLTGVGLGGATPNIIALTAEVAPPRARSTMITTMFAGFPLGAAIGGYISSHLIPAFGWESVFILGGAAPLVLLLALLPWLSESPHHLLRREGRTPRLESLLDRMAGPDRAPLPETPAPSPGTAKPPGYRALFAGGLAATTAQLWLAYFNSLLMIYFLMSWLPTVARESGLALDTAIISAVFLNLGGAIGGIVLGRFADRFGPFQTLAVGFAIAGISLVLIGFVGNQTVLLMTLAFIAGLFTIGGQTAMNAANAGLYPAEIRATALGGALAVGRIGSIVGPTVGGLLLAADWPLSSIFIAVSLPALLTAVLAVNLSRTIRRP